MKIFSYILRYRLYAKEFPPPPCLGRAEIGPRPTAAPFEKPRSTVEDADALHHMLFDMIYLHKPIYAYIYGTALGTPTPPPRGWSWFPAPPPVGVGGVVVDGWECWLMES